MVELSGEELAVRSGVTAQQLRRLVELGIIVPTPRGRFRPSDIQRIRVVDTLAGAGFAPEQLSELPRAPAGSGAPSRRRRAAALGCPGAGGFRGRGDGPAGAAADLAGRLVQIVHEFAHRRGAVR